MRLFQALRAFAMTWILLAALPAAGSEIVGEAFGKPVTRGEFDQHYKTTSLFSRTGEEDRTEEQRRADAWKNLILLKEANRLGIQVPRAELEEELRRLVFEKGIDYGGPMYVTWVKLNFQEEVKTFEGRLEGLLRINKLMKQKTDNVKAATEDEIRQKFLNQYNNFESEYVRFETPQEADAFLQQVEKKPVLWKETFDKKRKEKGQEGGAWINIMTIEALVDLWKMPKEDAYRVMAAKPGGFVLAKNYYGDCVFRLLFKRPADLNKLDDKMKEYYRNTLMQIRRYQLSKDFVDGVIQQANVKDYLAEKKQVQTAAERATQAEKLKEKSMVRLETNQGNIDVRLFPDVAPKACENFVGLVEKGYYDGLTFHRVIKNFMIQGGDPTGTGAGGQSVWGKPFEDEVDSSVTFSKPGLLAMANAGPNTNGSQFFITTVPTSWLNGKHTIFGEVIGGMEVVQKIESVPADALNKPEKPQKIVRAQVKK